MNCANCGAAMRRDAGHDCFVCDFCHSTSFPDQDADGVRLFDPAAGADCPVCRVRLMEASVAGYPVRFCAQCRGILAPVDEFLTLQAAVREQMDLVLTVPQAPEPGELERRLRCPQCGREMDNHYYGGSGAVVIDNCAVCGLNWLDHGELRRIASTLEPQLRPEDEIGWIPYTR